MIRENIGKNGNYFITFLKFNGSGWDDYLQSIIEQKIKPVEITKRIITQTWDYSEKEFDLEKEGLKFVLHMDDEGSTYVELLSEITEENKQKLREWAIIIAGGVEKAKK